MVGLTPLLLLPTFSYYLRDKRVSPLLYRIIAIIMSACASEKLLTHTLYKRINAAVLTTFMKNNSTVHFSTPFLGYMFSFP